MEDIILPPGIDSYLETIAYNKPISLDNLEELILRIRTYSNLDKEIVKIIVREFFQEMRNSILRGEEVLITGVGTLRLDLNNLSLYFYPSKNLLEKINV